MKPILTSEDWKKHKYAIVHNSTKNKSFREVATILKKLKVKNHNFLLALHNPLLEHVNPHADNLTEKQIAMVTIETRDNPWYFFREVLKAPPASSFEKGPFKASVANIMFLWVFFAGIIPFLVQPRQTGKTFTIFGLYAYLMTIGSINSNLTLLTKDNTLRAESMAILRRFLDNLPWYFKFMDKSDTNNTEKLTINARGMSLRILVARASAEDADGVGRGLTSPVLGTDEIAYFKNIHITLSVAIASTGAAMDNARRNGMISGIFYGTTAGKLNTPSGKFAYDLYRAGTKWSYKYLDEPTVESLIQKVKLNAGSSKGRIVPTLALEFNHLQLGFTDEWLKERIAKAGATGIDAEADYLNKWLFSNSTGLLTAVETKKVIGSVNHEHGTDIEYNDYMLNWHIPLEQRALLINKPFIIGSDTSDGAGDDELTLVFTDPDTGGVMATGNYNEVNLISFSNFLIHLLKTYKKSVLIIERKSSASAILDNIFLITEQNGVIDPVTRIFNKAVDNANPGTSLNDIKAELKIDALRTGGQGAKIKKLFGFTTTGDGRYARSLLFGRVLKNSIRLAGDKIRDKVIVAQMTSLVIKNNRLDHKAGDNDDLLFAYLLTQWFLQHANNKEHYGFNSLDIYISATPDSNEEKENKRVIKIRKEINNLMAILEDRPEPRLKNRYLDKLKKLEDSIGVGDITNTIDSVLTKAKVTSVDVKLNPISLRNMTITMRRRNVNRATS